MQFSAKPVASSPQAYGYSSPSAGNVYVAFDCTVKNVNADDYYGNDRVGVTYWQLRDNAGNVYDAEWILGSTPGYKMFSSVDTKPGDTVKGYVVFEVPADHGAWKSLSYNDGSRDVTITL